MYESCSFYIRSALGVRVLSSCPIKNGEAHREGDVEVSFLISDCDVSSSGDSGINSG